MNLDDRNRPGCGGCPLGDAVPMARREFLAAARAALASAGLLTLLPAPLAALRGRPARALPADPARPDEKRYPIPATDGVEIDRDASVIIARTAGRLYAFSLACPHQNTALRWEAGASQFRCPKHKSRYRADGGFIQGRATRDMDRLPVRREGDVLVVKIDTLYRRDRHPAEWAAAVITL